MAVGSVMGAGAFIHIGIAIGYTGYSAWLAYLTAVIMGILFCLPIIIATSALKLEGGFLFYFPGIAIVALSLGNYVHSLWPVIPARILAAAVLTVFYLLNLAGIKKIARAQKIMMAVTLCALFGFVIFGLGKVSPKTFSMTDKHFFQGGIKGFVQAVFISLCSREAAQKMPQRVFQSPCWPPRGPYCFCILESAS